MPIDYHADAGASGPRSFSPILGITIGKYICCDFEPVFGTLKSDTVSENSRHPQAMPALAVDRASCSKRDPECDPNQHQDGYSNEKNTLTY